MGKKGDSTRQHIRMSAFELFAKYGYTAVSMQDICTDCGLSKGGLYRHYDNKLQLFTDILRTLQEEEKDREDFAMDSELSAVTVLNRFLSHIRRDLDRSVPNINIALYEFCVENREKEGPEILSQQFQRGRSILLSLIKYGEERGEFRVSSPQGAADSILFLIEGLRMINEIMPVPEETVQDIFLQISILLGVSH